MKIYQIFLVSLISLFTATLSFAADAATNNDANSPFYVAGGVGASFSAEFPTTVNLNLDNSELFEEDFNTATGYDFALAAGYRFNQMFRAEVSANTIHNTVNEETDQVNSAQIQGNLDAIAVFLNGLMDFPVTTKIKLSFGLGLGYLNATLSPNGQDNSWKISPIAGQVILGGNYSFKPNLNFFIEYHYLRSASANSVTANSDLGSVTESSYYQTNLINAGIRYYL